MSLVPTALDRIERDLQITWSDGHVTRCGIQQLRDVCPCATCREKRAADDPPAKMTGLPVISMDEARPLTIEHMRPVGNYAYNIEFSDGHNSGIFTFEFLRSM